jgi:broad specificity phosphatase PhoE
MLNILLIRAASTEYTGQGRVQGTLDVPLSEDGRRQAELAAEQLSKHAVETLQCGPCRASRQTAELIGQHLGIKPKTNDLLHNLDLGLWQGMLIEEVKTKQPKVYRQWQERPETVCPPEGETLQHAQERLLSVQAKLVKKFKTGTVAMVLIDPLASVWRSLLLDQPIGDLWQMGGDREALWESIPLTAEPAEKG